MSPLAVTRALALVLLCLFATVAHADERILAYDSTLQVLADGTLEVTERITVRAEGDQIRRGIYRDFPTRYTDRYGNRVVVGFDVLEVLRDGRTEPWFTEKRNNGVRINTGNDDFLPVPAQYTYTLRYRTTRQVGFFDGFDELYFNAIGTGWAFPINDSRVEVRLPSPVPAEQRKVEGYTGPQGTRGKDFVAITPHPGLARWRLTRPLQPQEGFTIAVGFPKGVVTAPKRSQKVGWFFRDNGGVLVALLGWAALIVFCIRRWHGVGRDPRAGVVIARYEPPEGHGPAGLRYMRRRQHDPRCFSGDLLALAVAGHVRIDRDKGFFKDTWTLERVPGVKMDGLTASQRALLPTLFASGPRLELKDTNAMTLSGARTAQVKALTGQYQPQYFIRNGRSILAAAGIAVGTLVLAGLVSFGAGIPAIVGVGVGMLITVIVFAVLVEAPTVEGRKLLDEIEGLRLYLSVAEREDLARLSGPDPGAPPALDAQRFEHLLPYAVALDVEDAWTRKFTAAVGAAAAAAATASIGWYHGGGSSDLGSFTQALGSQLSSQISSASSPPGSSSGSGGGGSSGGGGGGGGGGGR